MNLRIYNFNNYYNRKVKILTPYMDEYSNYIYEIQKANFVPNDNVTASAIFGNSVSAYNSEGDYLVVTDQDNNLISRWFIIDQRRIKGGQWQLTLRRDLIADFYDEIIDSPVFIEKAILAENDVGIFNSEEMSFNQIKTSETKITDKTLCPWIVGYIARNASLSQPITFTPPTEYSAEYETLEEIPYYNLFSSGTFKAYNNVPYSIDLKYFTGAMNVRTYYTLNFDESGLFNIKNTVSGELGIYGNGLYTDIAKECSSYLKFNSATILNNILSEFNIASKNTTDSFLETYSEKGTIVKINSLNRYYKITRTFNTAVQYKNNPSSTASALYNSLLNLASSNQYLTLGDFGANTPSTANFVANIEYNEYIVKIEEVVNNNSYTFTLPSPENRAHLIDAPYDMFAIPYNINTRFDMSAGSVVPEITNTDPAVGMELATRLAAALGDNCYDVQLLPYCPMPEIVYTGGIDLDPDAYSLGTNYQYINDNNNAKHASIVLFPTSSSNSIIITKTYTQTQDGTIAKPIDIIIQNKKIANECDTWRLVSPNYSGQFEFNAAKNDGVDYFKVDFTYKPINPYIKIAPNFKNLYGANFNDARGLICGGDFSIPTLNVAWTQFENNHKNYQISFNREIESLELKNKYQKVSDITNAITGTIQGGTSGALTGGILGGGIGAGVGAAIGAGASAAAGIADVTINEILRRDALDLTKDQFGYNLQNIRAMPTTLAKVSAYNINNKLFPILEYYTCSDIEKEALINKIKYNGMTVMRIGKIRDFLGNTFEDVKESYIKGKLIRLENINDDFHIVNEIANELYKGVYI